MPKPPVNPDSFDKVNYVIDAWTTGCDAPWYIYVQTMKPAALTAFITLITFGWDDVLRGYFRPRGLYKRRTGKRAGKWNHRIPRFPELGNTLGKQLPGAETVRGKKWSTLGKTLWRIDGTMEMVRFFWLVAAIAEDFAFDWTSLLYESYWCQDDPPGRFSDQSGAIRPLPGGAWRQAMFTLNDYEYPPPVWYTTHGATGPNGAVVTAAMEFIKHPAFPNPSIRGVRVGSIDGVTVWAETMQNDITDPAPWTIVATGTVPPNTMFKVWLIHQVPWCYYGEGVVVGVETVNQ